MPFNPDRANQILDALGYQRGSDGIRVADGHPMSYDVVFAQDEAGAGTRAFQILQQGFRKVGVQINQRMMDDSAAWSAMYCGAKCPYRNFDMAMWDWFPAADPDFMLGAMTCAQWGNWNDSGYRNPAYDRLYEQQRRTTDLQARKKLVYQMQKMVTTRGRHYPHLRLSAGRVVPRVGRVRRVRAGHVQQLLDPEPAVSASGLARSRPHVLRRSAHDEDCRPTTAETRVPKLLGGAIRPGHVAQGHLPSGAQRGVVALHLQALFGAQARYQLAGELAPAGHHAEPGKPRRRPEHARPSNRQLRSVEPAPGWSRGATRTCNLPR